MNEERRDLNLNVEDQKKEGKVIPCLFHPKYSDTEFNPTEFLLYPHILQGPSFNALVGKSGSGKTSIELDQVLAYCSGFKEWFGHPFSDAKENRTAAYLCSEGYDELQKRIRAFLQVHNLPRTALDGHFFLFNLPEFLRVEKTLHITEKTAPDLMASLKAVAGESVDLIVIDTFNGFCGADENSNDKVGNYLSLVETYLESPFNAAMLFVHHTPKSNKGATSAADIEPRGASSFEGRMDSLSKVLGKIGTGVELINTKNRSTEEGTTDYLIGKVVDPIEDSPVDSHGNKCKALVIDWEGDSKEIESRRNREEGAKYALIPATKEKKELLEKYLASGQISFKTYLYAPEYDDEEEENGEEKCVEQRLEFYSSDLELVLKEDKKLDGKQLSGWLGGDKAKMMRKLEEAGLVDIEKLGKMNYRYILKNSNKYRYSDGHWDYRNLPLPPNKFLGEYSRNVEE